MIHFNASKILIPVDFSETSLLAIKHGALVAQRTGGSLHLLHVVLVAHQVDGVQQPVLGVLHHLRMRIQQRSQCRKRCDPM